MGTSARANGHSGRAAALLVDCDGGPELGVVRDTLTQSLNTPTLLVDHATLVSAPISLDLGTGLLTVGDHLVRPAVVWIRRSSACAMMAWAQPAGSMRPLDAASWAGLLDQMAASTTAALPGRTLAWPGQLTDAERHGVRAPRTVLATDITAGIRQVGTEKIIVKIPDFRLFEPDRRAWPPYLPEVIDRDDRLNARTFGHRPVVVQEYIAHARELRVYYLNGGLCAFDVRKPDPASLWTDPAGVTVTRVDCPEAAKTVVRTLCAAWHLLYAAFDLLVTRAGELVFLEANPDGDWLWFERKARWHGVSFMAAVMVHDLFVGSAGSARRTSLGAGVDDCDPR